MGDDLANELGSGRAGQSEAQRQDHGEDLGKGGEVGERGRLERGQKRENRRHL